MEYICCECKRPCDEHNSKFFTGKSESIEFGIHVCYECYYSDGRLVEIMLRMEQADKMLEYWRERVKYRESTEEIDAA